MSTVIDFKYITCKWASLRRFAGLTVESALDAVGQGYVDIAPYFAKLVYFLPFASRSLEKVLMYATVKAVHGYEKKDISYFEVTIKEIPEFEPDEEDKVRAAFESMRDLGLAEVIAPDRIRLKVDQSILSKVINPIAPYVMGNITPQNIDLEVISYPHRVISGVNSLYVMHRSGRLPSSFTIMMGLVSPVVYVKRGGTVERKNTIEPEEWNETRANIAKLKSLRDKFDVEYFKAIGVLYENKIIVRSYPIEISGNMIDLVIAPTYKRYYTLLRERKISKVRAWGRR